MHALKGAHDDFTALPLKRALLLLAVPMMLEMSMESLFAVVDVFWVSRLGSAAVAVVGLTESVMSLVYAVAIGISIAAGAIVARRIGEKDPERAAQAAGQIILTGVVVSAALGVVGALLAPQILHAMGATPEIMTTGTTFTRIMLGGNMTVFMIFLLNAIFRGAGDAAIAMRTLMLSNAINLVLDPCFIFGWGPFPELGVTGAAVATNTGRAIGVLYQLWHLTGRANRIRVRARHLAPKAEDLRAIASTSGSGVGQMLISMTSWVGLVKILSGFGASAVAGYTIAIRIVIFAMMPAWGLSNACATLVGQNLGAKKPERAEEAVVIGTKFNMIFLGVVGALFIAGAGLLVSLFTKEPDVYGFGKQALWIVSLGFPLFAAGMCYQGAFNGAGDTWTPTKLSFFCFWLGQIPLAWALSHPLGLGPTGIFISVPTSFSVMAVWSWVLFRQGKWKATAL